MVDKYTGNFIDVILVGNPSTNEMIDKEFYSKEDSERILNKDHVTLEEDYKNDEQKHHSSQPPMIIKDSGPTEKTLTETTGPKPIPATEIDMYEICPACDSVLRLYSTKDPNTREKTYRCKNCHQELVKSTIGWVIPYSQESIRK